MSSAASDVYKRQKASVLEKLGDYEAAHNLVIPLTRNNKVSAAAASIFARLCHRFDECDYAVKISEKILSETPIGNKERRTLLFSLGDIHDRLGDYEAAFACYQEANYLKVYHYDHDEYVKKIDRFIALQSPSLLSSSILASSVRTDSLKPVFIVGMPRSGTSLVEQILASHPMVYGAGERLEIPSIVDRLPSLVGNDVTPYPECLSLLAGEQVKQLSDKYLGSIGELVETEICVTDKLPENYHHLVLIRMLFPESPIIHCLRNPLDTCLSCYFHDFTGYHEYAYDLENLGRHYREYQRLMQHYRDELKIPMLEVEYEALVKQPEQVSRQMVEYCDLDWDERCLRYYETDRIVRTASHSQVREPVYTHSAGRWKNYENYIAALKESLQE